MSRRRRSGKGTQWRRGVQIAALLLFWGLLLWARPWSHAADPSPLLKSFFWIDPLVLVATFLAAHAVPAIALLSLLTVAVTLVLGRVFCGWFCPLGTLHAIAGRFFDRVWPTRKRRDHWSRWQLAKYYVLIALLVMALFRSHWGCIFDPLVLLYRTSTVALFPSAQWAIEDGSKVIYDADPGLGAARLTKVTEPAYAFIRDSLFVTSKQAFVGAGLICSLFLVTLVLNRCRRRFWCRYLCPLGALLGLLSWRPMLRRAVSQKHCNQCDLCASTCHGAAAAASGEQWRPAECFGCLNCTDSCARDALRFRWVWPWQKEPALQPVDLSRRAAMGAVVGGVAGLCLLRATPQSRAQTFNPLLIRPPGARPEREFLQRCTSCGMCMKICPTGGLQPATTEAGLEGLWTPMLVPRIGYCHYDCNRCGQVCPTEAIGPLTLEAKKKVSIGLAFFDTTRCIPYAYARDCIVCEEHCPISDKAIYTIEAEVQDHDGNKKKVKQPHVDPSRCTGCGICENVCPLKEQPGVRVASTNETRRAGERQVVTEDSPY